MRYTVSISSRRCITRNCRLAKILTAGKYEDYPKPLQKGISSYVALEDGAIIIGVFNQTAYDNLVAQVKAAGFVLDMPGNEMCTRMVIAL